jgi:hypothetical protein
VQICAKLTCNISGVSVTGKVKDRTLLIASIEGATLFSRIVRVSTLIDVISNIRC